jgi:trimeric autotransporter adhesin
VNQRAHAILAIGLAENSDKFNAKRQGLDVNIWRTKNWARVLRSTKNKRGWAAVSLVFVLSGCGSFFVSGNTLTSISVSPASQTILPGKNQQYSATGRYGDDSTKDITSDVSWHSSNESVVIIDSSGVATGSAIGSATINASASERSGSERMIRGSTTLTVSNVVVAGLNVTPSAASLSSGQTQQFVSIATYSDGSSKIVTNSAAWQSSDTSVATISNSGLATGMSAGTSAITAKLGTVVGSASLIVN